VILADATRPAPFRACFDAGLADVPCSGLGTLRRNPEIKWHFQPETFHQLKKRQLTILHQVSQTIRPGGRLLYSTCSTEPEENEQVIESFLASNPAFRLQQPTSPAGIESWTAPDKLVRTYPSTRGWDGFFAALMVRE
jgi:16S rRNA (cytosine967-C5)-methyltransferase